MFKWARRCITFVFLVFACLMAVVFSVENSQMISPIFLGISLPTFGLGLWMALSLLLGAITGLVISIMPVYMIRYRATTKEKKIQRLEKELSALRLATVRG